MSRYSSSHPDAPEGEKPIRVRVKWFHVTKGFGFVTPTDGSPDAFLHISVLNRMGLHTIEDGAELLCHVVDGPKGSQVEGIVELLGGGIPVRPPARTRSVTGPEQELSGTVKWFKSDKGFGFVVADDAGKDVFVHKSMLRRCNLLELSEGQRVHMKVHEADKGREATWLALL
jgi:CspA family cold shock protein